MNRLFERREGAARNGLQINLPPPFKVAIVSPEKLEVHIALAELAEKEPDIDLRR